MTVSRETHGYLEKYSSCDSLIFNKFLINETLLAVLLGLFLCYSFIGLAVLSDRMIEAIKRITSRQETVRLRDIEEKTLDVERPIWNSQKSYITFLALASSAPEVFMCFFNTFSDVNKTPSRFGPIVLIGSASFNLLVVTAVAITTSLEVKRVENTFALWTMAAFATAAYIWLYLVLQVITPG